MRDPKRIPTLIHALHVVWEANPDMRLTQLISNAAFRGGWENSDPFHCEDGLVWDGLTQMAEENTNAPRS